MVTDRHGRFRAALPTGVYELAWAVKPSNFLRHIILHAGQTARPRIVIHLLQDSQTTE